jgi:CDP-glucose 4,6-dehydratase
MLQVNPDFWKEKRVFITGHTGFKGSWLSLWLQTMGATLHGYALPAPTTPSLFEEAGVGEGVETTLADIRDFSALHSAVQIFKPDIIFHLSAQPLVRYSYAEPIETYSTNVMGTVHLLEAARKSASVRAIINVTTDKCYENREWVWGYREEEPMGGYDPYSSSKGCSELVTAAYRRSFFGHDGPALASARAGNVIGGGDWAQDRLIPDMLRAFQIGQPAIIRNPASIRPWQHVLEPLSCYLALAERLFLDGNAYAEAWNFGPQDEDARTVAWIARYLADAWGPDARWQLDARAQPHESNYLKLDISKAKARLNYAPRWSLATGLDHILAWHRGWLNKENARKMCENQIAAFCAAAPDSRPDR